MADEHKPNWFEKYTLLMDQNIRGVQYGVYSIAVIGLGIALRSVKPFKKFSLPQDIPKSFVEKHLTLRGKVVAVQPSLPSLPPLLLVDHSPIIPLPWVQSNKPSLPIQISGVDVTINGYSWLQHVVVGSPVYFTILKTDPKYVSCIVNCINVSNKKTDVAVDLLSLGFASVTPLDFDLETDRVYLKYYKNLLSAENDAEKLGSGIWSPDQVSSASRIVKTVLQSIYSGSKVAAKGVKVLLSKPKSMNQTSLSPTGKT